MRNNLAKIRGKHGLTQEKLAEAIGMSKQGLSFNETGKISAKTAKLVADELGENVFDILGSDVFRVVPKTKEDRDAVLRILTELVGE